MSQSSQPAWLQVLPRSNRPGSMSTERSHLWQGLQTSPKNYISLSLQTIGRPCPKHQGPRFPPWFMETSINPQLNVSNSNRTALASIRHYRTLGLERATSGHWMSFPCQCKQEHRHAQPSLCPFQRCEDRLVRKNTLLLPCLHHLPCSPRTHTALAAGSAVPAPLWRVCPAQPPTPAVHTSTAKLAQTKVQSKRQQKIEAGLRAHHIVYF